MLIHAIPQSKSTIPFLYQNQGKSHVCSNIFGRGRKNRRIQGRDHDRAFALQEEKDACVFSTWNRPLSQLPDHKG